MIWAAVRSRSCFCWLYIASPSSATKNIISLISALAMHSLAWQNWQNSEAVAASILGWFAIPSSSGSHFVRTLLQWHVHLGWPYTARLMAPLNYTSPFARTRQWSVKGQKGHIPGLSWGWNSLCWRVSIRRGSKSFSPGCSQEKLQIFLRSIESSMEPEQKGGLVEGDAYSSGSCISP